MLSDRVAVYTEINQYMQYASPRDALVTKTKLRSCSNAWVKQAVGLSISEYFFKKLQCYHGYVQKKCGGYFAMFMPSKVASACLSKEP